MSFVMIRFEGLCCHIKNNALGVARRTVLPATPDHHPHISYIEMYAADLKVADNPDWAEKFIGYQRFGEDFVRVEIRNERVELISEVRSTTFDVHGSFDQRIPQLTKVSKTFKDIKPALVDKEVIDSGVVAGYFDMKKGMLAAGPPEYFVTTFKPSHVWAARHLAQWAQLEIEIVPPLKFRVTNLATKKSRELVLSKNADLVTIGNQMRNDILGQPVTNGGPGAHFDTYYDLAKDPVTDRPKPEGDLGMGTGCSNSGYP